MCVCCQILLYSCPYTWHDNCNRTCKAQPEKLLLCTATNAETGQQGMEAMSFMVRLGTAWSGWGEKRRMTEDLIICRAMPAEIRDVTTSKTHYHN